MRILVGKVSYQDIAEFGLLKLKPQFYYEPDPNSAHLLIFKRVNPFELIKNRFYKSKISVSEYETV